MWNPRGSGHERKKKGTGVPARRTPTTRIRISKKRASGRNHTEGFHPNEASSDPNLAPFSNQRKKERQKRGRGQGTSDSSTQYKGSDESEDRLFREHQGGAETKRTSSKLNPSLELI